MTRPHPKLRTLNPAGAAQKYTGPLRAAFPWGDTGDIYVLVPTPEWLKATCHLSLTCSEDENKKTEAGSEHWRSTCLCDRAVRRPRARGQMQCV